MSKPKPNTGKPTRFTGEFWNVDPETKGMTRFQFTERKGRNFVSAWGSCFPSDCEWGETELFRLKDIENRSKNTEIAFATWRHDSTALNHLLFRSTRDGFSTEQICLHAERRKRSGYYAKEYFCKDPVRSATPPNPLRKFSNMWDGSEPGWKLVRYRQKIYFIEFRFRQSGPTRREFELLKDYLYPVPDDDTGEKHWKRMRGSQGSFDGVPHGQREIDSLKNLRRRAGKSMVLHPLKAGELLASSPKGFIYPFHCMCTSWRQPVIAKMLEARVKIVTRDLK